MKTFKVTTLLLLSIVIAGCQSTGGIIGGLIPAPKFLDGEIENNIYTSKDKMFSVRIPHIQDSYEYKYMEVKEQYSDLGVYISFGPAAFDKSIYRIETGYRLTPESKQIDVESMLPQMVGSFVTQLENGYGTNLELQSKDKTIINGNNAWHWVWKQNIPAGKHISNRSTVFKHEAYVVELNNIVSLLWVQTPTEHNSSPDGKAITPLAFAQSLTENTQQGVQK
ncbi:MAG: hypothetical protein KZQ93_19890 [Candidatus Thiodiazotropha sp. (ex Monitilora ramsayi)]|nr:hypothetical protein [Candidatus Thiodiazotropha sp. (ex Monitilora ramsayi)]